MAVRLLVSWLFHKPGDIIDRGAAVDEKLIAAGKAEPIVTLGRDVLRAGKQPKEKRNGSA